MEDIYFIGCLPELMEFIRVMCLVHCKIYIYFIYIITKE